MKSALDRETQFLCRAALLALTGFLAAGMFDYTYGHSLGLILVGFVALAPLVSAEKPEAAGARSNTLALLDRGAGALLFVGSLPVLIPAAIITRVLSGRSPFIAHLRIGQNGQQLWVWKLRTMWQHNEAVSPWESGCVQRIECDPPVDIKPECDPRITSRFCSVLPPAFH